MELIKNELDTLRIFRTESGSFQLEQEAVVPDVRPDVKRVVCCSCSCSVTEKTLRDGRLRIGGEAALTAFCEGMEGEIYPITVMIPFGGSTDMPGCDGDDICILHADPLSWNCGIVNSRKLRFRCQSGWTAEVRKPVTLRYGRGITASEREGVQTDIRREELEIISAAVQKRISVTEEVRLTAGAVPGDELCRCDLRWTTEDVKLVSGKAMVRGTAEVTAVSISAAGSFVSREKLALPFSQMLDIPGASETDRAEARCEPVRLDATLSQGQDGGVYLNITAVCEVTLTASRTVVQEVLRDAYSVCRDLGCRREECELPLMGGEKIEKLQISESFRPEPPCLRVLDHKLVMMPLAGRNGAVWRLGILYETAEGSLASVQYGGEVQSEEVCVRAEAAGVKAAADGSGGVGFSAEARLYGPSGRWEKTEQIISLSPGEKRVQEHPSRVVLRSVQPGETLWSIAKSCLTTKEALMNANGIAPGEMPEAGRLILIPFAANKFGG